MTRTTIEAAKKELDGYLNPDAGWIERPNPVHVKLVQKFMDGLPNNFSAPTPMVGTNGKVGFYWYERPFFMDAEVEPDEQFSVLIRLGTYRDRNERWYPGMSLAEMVAIYTAHVAHWTLVMKGTAS